MKIESKTIYTISLDEFQKRFPEIKGRITWLFADSMRGGGITVETKP